MIKTIIGTLTLGLLVAANANATSWTITGPDSVMVGDSFSIEITADHGTEGLFAGGVLFNFDTSLVSFESFAFNENLGTPGVGLGITCPGTDTCADTDFSDGTADIVVGGIFAGPGIVFPVIAANAGPTLIATIFFTALATPSEADANFTIENSPTAGGWFDANFEDGSQPDFTNLTVNVETAVVPLPAAVWFMIGGLGTLLGYRRK